MITSGVPYDGATGGHARSVQSAILAVLPPTETIGLKTDCTHPGVQKFCQAGDEKGKSVLTLRKNFRQLTMVATIVSGTSLAAFAIPAHAATTVQANTKPIASSAKCTPAPYIGRRYISPIDGHMSTTPQPDSATLEMYDAGHGIQVSEEFLPTGWNPLTATGQELAGFGFDARPTDATHLALWKAKYANFKGTPADDGQPLCEGAIKHGQVGTQGSSTANSEWIGYSDVTPALPILDTAATIQLPPPNVLSCSSASTASFWVGTDNGITNSGAVVDQTGIDFDPTNDTGYQYWAELLPEGPYYFGGSNHDMPFHAHDSIHLTDKYNAVNGGTFNFSAVDATTGGAYYITYTGAASLLGSRNADFIVEELAGYKVRNFGQVAWSAATATLDNGTTQYLNQIGYDHDLSEWGNANTLGTGTFRTNWSKCL